MYLHFNIYTRFNNRRNHAARKTFVRAGASTAHRHSADNIAAGSLFMHVLGHIFIHRQCKTRKRTSRGKRWLWLRTCGVYLGYTEMRNSPHTVFCVPSIIYLFSNHLWGWYTRARNAHILCDMGVKKTLYAWGNTQVCTEHCIIGITILYVCFHPSQKRLGILHSLLHSMLVVYHVDETHKTIFFRL